MAATKQKKSEDDDKVRTTGGKRRGHGERREQSPLTPPKGKTLPRLRMLYIGRLSSRVGTIESWRGRVDTLSDLQTIDVTAL